MAHCVFKKNKFAKYDSKLDFNSKSIPKLESNAKVTEKASEITISPLRPNKKKKNSF